jgi:anti-anti-sigma regulatory factor
MVDAGQDNGSHSEALLFPEELTIASAGEFYQQFISRLEQGGDIAVDGGAVTRIDTAFIQLLYMVQRSLAETGSRLLWKACSPAIVSSVELLGMQEHLELSGEV